MADQRRSKARSGPNVDYSRLAEEQWTRLPELDASVSSLLHYTNLSALYSIIETGNLRHSSLRSMNDPSEWEYGSKLIFSVATDYVNSIEGADRELLDWWLQKVPTRPPFVFSMTIANALETVDGDLNQWRLYGSNGRGVVLVFDYFLDHRDEFHHRTGRPYKVIYDSKAADRLVRERLDSFFEADRSWAGDSAADAFSSKTAKDQFDLAVLLGRLAAIFKHPAYKVEREARLISYVWPWGDNKPLTFSQNGEIMRPHMDVSFVEGDDGRTKSSNLSKIIVGPSGDQDAIADSISHFLIHHDMDVAVSKADIPYRAV